AMTYRNDDRGRPVEQRYIPNPDAQGPRNAPLPGVQRTVYDDDGNVVERWTAGAVPARTKMRYDSRGNVTQEAYFDDAGKPVTVSGVHRVTTAYNERGRMTERAFFGTDGRPAQELRPLGRSAPEKVAPGPARWTWSWDEQGNIVEVACFGPD